MKLTLTEALVKLKLYDKKIEKKYQTLSIGKIIDIQKGKSNKLLYSDLEITNFKNEAKSYIDSIKQLIKNRATLKSKIVEANAKTKLTIANKEYNIAEAIERKNSIEYDKELVRALSEILENAKSEVLNHNQIVENEVDEMIKAQLENENKSQKNISKETETLREMLLSNKEYKLINPLNLEKIIDELNTEIEEFESEVDVKLSIANSNTFIEI